MDSNCFTRDARVDHSSDGEGDANDDAEDGDVCYVVGPIRNSGKVRRVDGLGQMERVLRIHDKMRQRLQRRRRQFWVR